MRLTSGENAIDPLTGLTVILGQIRTTQSNRVRSTQVTGAPPGSLNTLPGTDPVFSSAFYTGTGYIRATQAGDTRTTQDGFVRVTQQLEYPIGLPYGYTNVPNTGPLS